MNRFTTWAIYLIYLCTGILFYWVCSNRIHPDGVSYMLIAEKYSAGYWFDAVNSYWSPLLTWLAAPFIACGINAMDAIRLVGFLTGFLVLYKSGKLFMQIGFSRPEAWVVQVLLIPCIAYMAVVLLVPDLLSAYLVVWFFEMLVIKKETSAKKIALLIALAYLAKYYNLVALSAFTVFYFLIVSRNETFKIRAKHILVTGLFTLLFITPWLGAMYTKYGYITLSDTGKYNHGINNPYGVGHVAYTIGITAPYEGSNNVWERPALEKIRSWNFFESGFTFNHLKLILERNFHFFIDATCMGSWFFLLLGVCLLLLGWYKKNKLVIVSMLFVVLYSLIYFFILIEDRYVWPCYFIFLLGFGAGCIQQFHRPWVRLLPLILFLGMFSGYRFIAAVHLESKMDRLYQNYTDMSACLEKNMPGIKKLASDAYNWNEGLYVSYYSNSTFYNASTSTLNLQEGIRTHGIEAFIGTNDTAYYEFAQPLCYFDKRNVVIWKVKNRE